MSRRLAMLWKLNSKGEPEMMASKLMKSSSFGTINVYEIGGQTIMETSDIVAMGVTREKFLKQEMPKVRKALGIEESSSKVLRKGKKEVEEDNNNRLKKLLEPIKPTIEIKPEEIKPVKPVPNGGS